MSSEYPYPFDNTGLLASNKIAEEKHQLSFYSNATKTIIPIFAPFFRNSLKVYHTETGKYLTEGIDFYLGHIFESGQSSQRYSMYGSISFNDTTITGNVKLEYQTVGGPYTIPYDEILIYLSKEFDRPRSRVWAEVMKYPRDIVPVDPINSIDEAIERDPVAGALNDMDIKIRELYAEQAIKLDQLFEDIKDVDGKIVEWGFPHHDHIGGSAHSPTPGQLGALALKGTAKDSLKAYNKTLAELVAYVETINTNQSKLSEYMPLSGGLMRGRILFDNNNAVIENGNASVTIDLRTGDVRINVKGNMRFNGNSNNNQTSNTVLRSGLNRLVMSSVNNVKDDDCLSYNGYAVLHAGNIADMIPDLKESKLGLFLEQSPYVTLRGKGRGSAAAPLEGSVTFPKATTSKKGVIILTHSFTADSTALVPTLYAINQLRILTDSYMPNDRTINGKPVTGNITISDFDLGLDKVNNTAPDDKLSSNAFIAEANKKVSADHTHTFSELGNWKYAGINVHGMFQLSNDLTSKSTELAATPSAGYAVTELINDIEAEGKKFLPNSAVDVTSYGGTSGLPISVSGSFLNNGYREEDMGRLAMVIDGGYLKYLRNGNSYGEVPRAYYGYATINNGEIGEPVNTTVLYEPPFIGTGRVVTRVITSRDGYMLMETSDANDGGNEEMWLVKIGTKIEAALHRGIKVTFASSTLNGSSRPNDIFVANGYVYVINWKSSDCDAFNLYRIQESSVDEALPVTAELLTMSWDHIGGQSSGVDVVICASNGLTDSNYSVFGKHPGDSLTALSLTHASGVYRNIYYEDGQVYLYIGRKGRYYHPVNGSHWFHWHATHVIDLSASEVYLADGWPDSKALKAQFRLDGTYISNGNADRRANETRVSKVNYHDYRGYGQMIGDYEISVMGLGRDWLRMTVDSYKADKVGRVYYQSRYAESDAPVRTFPVESGKAIGNRIHGYNIARLPEKGTGATVTCIVGRDQDSFWAHKVDLDSYRADIIADRYTYADSWEIDYGTYVGAMRTSVNQASNVTHPVWIFGATSNAGRSETLNYNNLTFDFSGSALDTQFGNITEQRSVTVLNSVGSDTTRYNALITIARHGKTSSTNFRIEVFYYRANITNVGDAYTLRSAQKMPGIASPHVWRDSVNMWAVGWGEDWRGGTQCYVTSSVAYISMPCLAWGDLGQGQGTHMAFKLNLNNTDIVSLDKRFSSGLSSTSKNSALLIKELFCLGNHDSTFTASIGTVHSLESASNPVYSSRRLTLTAIRDNWTVFFTAEQKYFTAGTEYVLPTDNFDLKSMFPGKYANNIFYIYANVIGTNPVYEILETMEEDYGTRTYIGYVTTGSDGILELDVRPALRLGRLQELIDHINNPVAHTGGKIGGDAIGLDKVSNLDITHEFDPGVYEERKYVSESAVLDYRSELLEKHKVSAIAPSSAAAVNSGLGLTVNVVNDLDDVFGIAMQPSMQAQLINIYDFRPVQWSNSPDAQGFSEIYPRVVSFSNSGGGTWGNPPIAYYINNPKRGG